MNKTYPDSIVVDENDNFVEHMQMPEAYAKDKILRVVVTILVNSRGEILLQKRGPNINSPNVWGMSSSGHVDVGDSYLEAAQRELEEELGIVSDDLEEIQYGLFTVEKDGKRFRSYRKYYILRTDEEPMVDGVEVTEARWISVSALENELAQKPETFIEGFSNSIEYVKSALADI